MNGPFSGTLFRFPLRNADQAENSKLSRQAYSEDDISSMFLQLYKEAVFSILFLKNILSVEMYMWDHDAQEPHKLYSCSINSVNSDIVWHRQALLRASKAVRSPDGEIDCFLLDFLSESISDGHSKKRIDTFFIVQSMAPASSRISAFAAAAAKEYDFHLLPWVSVAACISNGLSESDVLKQGQAFCFLPLPVRTGLNVQVNGYFEVSSNRRSIWFGADMDRAGKLRSDWNKLLLMDVVAPAFSELLLGVRERLGPSKLYYSLWPRGSFDEPWNILAEWIYKKISRRPVLYSDVAGGKWVSPDEAFIHDEVFYKAKELADTLILLEMPIVHLPDPLGEMLSRYATNIQKGMISPRTVRNFLRECKIIYTLNKIHRLILLEYCLSDLLDADVGEQMTGLPLLPLASGEFGLFSESSKGVSYFICNEMEYKLLNLVSDRVIDRSIFPCLLDRLSEIGRLSSANLALFDIKCFLQFVNRFFPVDWKHKSRVAWNTESSANHPKADWFMLFWQYIRDRCPDLSVFSDWPILPSTSGHLYKASKSSKLINVQYLSDTLKELLENIGCKILDTNYGIDHRDLYLYVYDANGTGVLSAISESVSSEGDSSLMMFNNFADTEINELRKFLFDPKWYIGGSLSDSHLKICKKLPIFRLYGGPSNQSHHFSDLARSLKYLPPVDIPDFLLDSEFIHSSSNTEEGILSRYFGIQRMGRAFFYRQKVLNKIENLLPEFRDNVMISILQDLPQLCIEDASLRESLKSLKFVTTISGTLKCPQSLYDPRIEELCALLEDSDCFPSDSFQDSGVLDMLQGLGLRTSVSSDTVIQSARQVELMMHSDPLKAHSRGKVLLSYLEANANKWHFIPPNNHKKTMKLSKGSAAFMRRDMPLDTDLEKFWNDLRMICWCPVLVIAPLPTLPWPSASSTVAPPKLVRPLADMWLVSASMRILDGDYSSTALMYGLGWSVPPSGSVIAAQLLELGKNNDLVTDQVFRQELALAMPKIYSLLMALIGSDEMEIVRAVLEGCRWIWVGDGFATVDEVVLKGHLHLAPYIRVIPVDLEVFRDLLVELGIRESLKPIDYASILCRMAIKKDRDPLDVQELRAAILVVQHLAEVRFQDLQVQIYLPDMSARLCPATDLVYNDAPWLLGPEESASEQTFTIPLTTKKNTHKLVHGNISNDIAERLGVSSLRRLLLAESSDSMNLSLSGVAEAFGQHEDLTTRLKHIVEMYADGPGILFELMQNAEDAGASEVVFLLDRTQYGTSSILSPEMAAWQGPALYCFNNSVFSPQDLYAISRIGQDSKLENPSAIGRFGLGFNCVYHFTDVPSFVSGENIVMFDPHACHLPGISPSHPGLRIKFVGRRILDQFPDQFAPYLHFGCDLQKPYPGTLFRFPLRNENAASRSQIKKEKYAPEDVLSLFSSFSEVVAEVLLFLRNVNTVSILIKDGSTPEVQLVHRVSRQRIKSKAEPHLLHSMLDFVHGNKKSGMDKEQFLNKLNKTVDKDLPWSCQKIVIKEWNSFGEKLHSWITGECLGGGRAKSKSLVLAKKSHNFIPWACVAAHLHSSNTIDVQNPVDGLNMELNQNTTDSLWVPADSTLARKEFEGLAFCFLPLPISTGLPAHVNAYFELSSNRRDIWFGNDMAGGGKVRSDWNTFLIEDAIAPAYGRLLEHIAVEVGPCDMYYSFWPTSTQREPWASMIRKLYTFISDNSLQVLYTKARGGQWISTKQAIFPDFSFPRASELADVLSESGLPLVTVSPPVVERFMEAYPSLHFMTPQLLRSLLIRRRRGFKNKEAMILTLEYCLSDLKGPGTCDCLYGLPLIPLANGSFTAFTNRTEGERIFLACQNEYYLLKDSLPHLLVECTLPDGVLKSLHDIAQTGETNISFLTCKSLVELLPKLLPTEWQYAKRVSWNPNHLGQPSVEWMALLWSYLKSSCNDLSVFSDWPILPVSNGCLLQLVVNSYVIKDDGWSENMSSLLQKLGCLFLRSDIMVDHSQLQNFVQDASATGILNALHSVACQRQDIEGLFCVASEAEMHELRSFILQSKWFNDNQMNSCHSDTIKLLPIFESYKSRKYVSLTNPVKCLKPDGISEDLLNEEFVRTESERERNIMRNFLGIKEPSRTEFYKDYVLNRMSEIILEPPVLSVILLDVKVLIEEDSSFKSALSQMSFVLAANGSWQHPSKLYDPRIPGFQKLLHKEAFFPSKKFSSTEILETLFSMGLKRNLGFTGLLDCARSVSMMHHSGDSQAMSYGQRLLLCLDSLGFKIYGGNSEETHSKITNEISNQENGGLVNDDTLFIHYSETDNEKFYIDPDIQHCLDTIIHDIPEDQLWSKMMTIDWCPVYVDPPIQGLPWFTSISRVASPEFARPSSQMWLVSSKLRILDGKCCSDYVQGKLGWMNSPSISVLSNQLIELSRSYCQIKLQSVEEPFISTVLQREIPALYSKLQDSVGSSDFVTLKASLDGVPWVWIGDNFVLPKHLAFDSPVKYHPYLYVVPTELSEFRILLSELGVKLTFDTVDYLHVLQHLQQDLKGEPLSPEQLNFVHRVLEAVVDCFADKQVGDALLSSVLIPDSSGILMCAADLVYNDAPWMEKNSILNKHFTHPIINDDLAKRLGVQSLRCLSLVNEEMTKDLPCMDYMRICELLTLYGDGEFLLFDLLELADRCKSKKLHVIFDKREHPRQSLLQHNLGDFQGSSLIVILEGTSLSREELCGLQNFPPWRLRGSTINYGLGLLSCYYICDLLSVLSCGNFYIFDPRGLVLPVPPSKSPSAKMFTLTGTDLIERFHDQFQPMLISKELKLSSSDCTVIRIPLSQKCLEELKSGSDRVNHIFDQFTSHASSTLLFLQSIFQVSLYTWSIENSYPSLQYSISVDPSIARNPFSDKKWRKFQISKLFSSSHAAIKLNAMDVHVLQGETKVVDKWLIALSMGSGQTRNMALDRRYLAYNLTPVAGVAAHISQNGQPIHSHSSCRILSPLPLSEKISLPVTAVGSFIVSQNGGRYLFNPQDSMTSSEQHLNYKNHLIEAWNRELMSSICDSYVELVLQFQKLRKDPLTSRIESSSARAISFVLHAYGDKIYSFWPRSKQNLSSSYLCDTEVSSVSSNDTGMQCIIDQVVRPFYARLVELPVWQLYQGSMVKAEEGMFLSQLGSDNISSDGFPPTSVCSFIKEHYPVFSVPWELVSEIQAVGVTVKEIKPKMVRDLLKDYKIVTPRSIETYIDVLDYCVCDILLDQPNDRTDSPGESSNDVLAYRDPDAASFNMPRSHDRAGNDALEMMTSFGKALYDLGRGVVEDIGRVGGPSNRYSSGTSRIDGGQRLPYIAAEIKGVPFPTTKNKLVRLGGTEVWIGNKEEQFLLHSKAENFIHPECLDRPVLAKLLSDHIIHMYLNVRPFTSELLSDHMRSLFSRIWVNQVMVSTSPWVSWDNNRESPDQGPSPEWIRLFWKSSNASTGNISLFSDWPLIPCFLCRPVLCRIKERHLVFIPPLSEASVSEGTSDSIIEGTEMTRFGNNVSEFEMIKSYSREFDITKSKYPWLFLLLNQFNIPVYDISFLGYGASLDCFPTPGQSLGQAIVSKLFAAKQAGYFTEPVPFLAEDRDKLFALFASEFTSNNTLYMSQELDFMRALPIYKTVLGTYTCLHDHDQCIIPRNAFFQPRDERCLSNSTNGSLFLHALGVEELRDPEIFIRFGLPGFESKASDEQEDILVYLFVNWQELQLDSTIVNALKETKFIRNASPDCVDMFRPKDLFDPCDSLLASIFSGERQRFPGDRFATDGWLHVLRKTGLRTSLEADVIVECARKIEYLGIESMKSTVDPDGLITDFSDQNEVSTELWSLATSLVDSIFLNFALLYSNTFCNTLSKISFVPAEKGFPTISGKKGGKRVLSSYGDAILLKDWPLAWSSAPILSRKVVPPEYSWGVFHLRSPPAFPLVLKHLQVVGRNNGEDTLAHWPVTVGMMTIEEATCEVLKYLDKAWESLSSQDKLEVQKVAFLPVANGTRLVTVNSLLVHLPVNLSPFAFELPVLFLPFVKILKDVGIQDTLSIFHAKDLLSKIQMMCGYQRLNPNELRAVMEILHFFSNGVNQARSDWQEWVTEAIVPDDGCRLVLARSCVYIDTYGSHILSNIDISRIRFVHPKVPEKICTTLGIKKLSDAVVEEMDHDVQLEILDDIGSLSVKTIKDKLLRKSLQMAIWTVINSKAEYMPSIERISFTQLQSSLESIAEKMQFVGLLQTRFFLLPKHVDITRMRKESAIPEWVGSTGHRSIYFVDRSRNHILVAEPPSHISVFDVIAIVVSQVLGFSIALPLGPLLSSPDDSEKAILDVLKLGSEKGENNFGHRSNVLIGSELLVQDALLVQFLPLRPFYAGEIVAWRMGKDGEKLKYGRVPEDVRPSSGQALYRFNVETSLGESQLLLSSQVFSFKSMSSTDGSSSSSSQESIITKVGTKTMLQISSDDGSSGSQSSKQPQYGQVSALELVQAVHDMLSTAGIDMDSEKQTLLQTTLNLQEQLKESQATLLLEQEKADMAAKEADAAKAAWVCRICLTSEVSIAIVPCGHVLCLRCSSAVSRCPFCRVHVSKTLKIYRP
ncbi:hypothetical protein QJS04_geneDACA019168 [Acorus gramineus]|uniref:RING-type domain-containing protein n=1 Tax=Acorus gramineus TaxID=55184 RepID=A0AAV9BBM7_ACOGR|nr:hypothetical protein QJS04_geneDACA019168 [Acorus gramineus]